MQRHEEVLNVRAVDRFQAALDQTEQAASLETVDNTTIPQVSESLRTQSESQVLQRSPDSSTHKEVSPSPHFSESLRSSTASSGAQRPGTIMITEHPTEALAPSPLVRALLTPPPNYLAPVRLLHHHLCKLLCPVQYQQYLPPRPDSVLWLDTLIFVILSMLTVMLLSKIARSWTRIVYAMFQALERISGIDMSFITQRFSPNRLPNHPYGQYWTSGGTATGAGLHPDRTRLRNMDTAMRARDIIKRFGRVPQADGAPLRAPAQPPIDGGT